MVEKEKVRRLVRDWFARTAKDEWGRLKRDAYHQLVFLVTMHFLESTCWKKDLFSTLAVDRGDTRLNW